MTTLLGIVGTWVNRLGIFFENSRECVLKNIFYIDEEIFEAEQRHIFHKLWIFVGLTIELPDAGTWIVRKITNKEIVVVFDGSTYFAHENVCPHKNMRLMAGSEGKSPLVCRYHSWSFKVDGTLSKIPNFEKVTY